MSEPDIYWAGSPNYSDGNDGIGYLFPHWTCGGFDSAVETLQDPGREASAHYVIEDGRVAQLVSEDDSAWHCGNRYYNHRSVSYELVGWEGHPPSYDTLDTCARMMADASRRYFGGAPLVLGENVMLHRWVYSTDCPGETDIDWLVAKANEYLNGGGTPMQEPGDPMNDAGMWYRVHAQDLGWLDAVRDGQVAGTIGSGLRMEAFKMTPPPGWTLYAKAHVQDVGWVTYPHIRQGDPSGEGSSQSDPIIGTVGEGRRIEALIIGVEERPAGDNRRLWFKVHQQNVGWKAWTEEGYASGADGMKLSLEAIQIVIE